MVEGKVGRQGGQGRSVGGSAFALALAHPLMGRPLIRLQVALGWPAGREPPDNPWLGQREPLDLGPWAVRAARRASGILERRAPPTLATRRAAGREARAFWKRASAAEYDADETPV